MYHITHNWFKNQPSVSKEYATLKIPKELADNIDRFIEENPELGYKSRAEFTKEAIRRHINELSK